MKIIGFIMNGISSLIFEEAVAAWLKVVRVSRVIFATAIELWEELVRALKIPLSVTNDFLPIFFSLAGMVCSVLHNLWASDYTQAFYFPFNPTRKIFLETHIYFIGDRLTLCFAALTLILLCLPRWSGLIKMYIPVFKLLLILEAVTLLDYMLTGNKDLMIAEFDSNTIKLTIYGIYISFFYGKRLFESIKYENS